MVVVWCGDEDDDDSSSGDDCGNIFLPTVKMKPHCLNSQE